MKAFLVCTLLFTAAIVWGQNVVTINGIPRDTSYTVQSSYEKYKKDHPNIQPACIQNRKNVKHIKEITYATYGKRKMPLDVFKPKNKGTYPVVIMIHGGGWISGNKNLTWPMAEYLASNGYVCVAVEYRMLLESPYPAAILDIKTAIRFIRANAKKYSIDTEKIAIYGCSAGGQMAALVAATNGNPFYIDEKFYPNYPEEVQALIDLDGVIQFLHPKSSEASADPAKPSLATRWLGATPKQNPELWAEASALTHIGENMPPALFIGSQYDRFLAGHDEAISRMNAMGIYTEKHTVSGSPHAFWLFEPWFTPVSQWVLGFLDNHLK